MLIPKTKTIIKKILVKERDNVTQNQKRVQIVPEPQFTLELKRDLLKLHQARLTKKRYQQDLQRQQNLFKEGLVTLNSVELAEKAVTDVENEINMTLQLLTTLEKETGQKIIDSWDWKKPMPFHIYVVAPFNGTILAINKLVEDPVYAKAWGEENYILLLGDLSEYSVRYYANEMDISKIQEGQIAELIFDVFPGKIFSAKVDKVSYIASRLEKKIDDGIGNSNFFKVKLLLNDVDPDLRVGMSSNIKIIVNKKKEILVAPIESIVKEEGGVSIALVFHNGAMRKVKVKTGIFNEHDIELEDGIEEGEKICRWPLLILEKLKYKEMEKSRSWVEKLIR